MAIGLRYTQTDLLIVERLQSGPGVRGDVPALSPRLESNVQDDDARYAHHDQTGCGSRRREERNPSQLGRGWSRVRKGSRTHPVQRTMLER